MLQGKPEELQKLNDYLVGIGYKTRYARDFEDFIHKSYCNLVIWFYDSCRFSIELTRQGKFLIKMDCLIKTDFLSKAYDTPKDSMVNYFKKEIEIPFEDANLKGIQNILNSNVRIIKDMKLNEAKQILNKKRIFN